MLIVVRRLTLCRSLLLLAASSYSLCCRLNRILTLKMFIFFGESFLQEELQVGQEARKFGKSCRLDKRPERRKRQQRVEESHNKRAVISTADRARRCLFSAVRACGMEPCTLFECNVMCAHCRCAALQRHSLFFCFGVFSTSRL